MLAEKIVQDLVLAQKQRDEVRVAVLRYLRSEIQNKEIAEKKKKLEDSQVESILRKEAKKREEAIQQFRQAGREELADREEKELEIVKSYLPEPLSDEELEKIIKEVIAESDFSQVKDFGSAMKEVMARLRGRADGAKVTELVKKELNKE